MNIVDASAAGWTIVRGYEARTNEEHCDDERIVRKTESRAFKLFRNITKSNPTPNSKDIKRNKIESAQRNISTYGRSSIN
jgi:hypothetical protein